MKKFINRVIAESALFGIVLFPVALIFVPALFMGCSDTEIASFKAIGDPGHITCYSGGQVIYDGDSTGKIATEQGSDGWLFMDAKTKRLVRISGDCIIRN